MEVKKIDIGSREFMANGVKYYIQLDGISVGRFHFYEKYVQLSSFGTDFQTMMSNYDKIYNALTDGNNVMNGWYNAVLLSRNQKQAIKERTELKNHSILYLCSLFINRLDEDITDWDTRIAESKIDDWKKEGIDMADFFLLGTKLINGFTSAYQDPVPEVIDRVRYEEKVDSDGRIRIS